MDYDMVLVMADGGAAEIGSPSELLQKNGIFADLVDATGPESGRMLRQMVQARIERIPDAIEKSE